MCVCAHPCDSLAASHSAEDKVERDAVPVKQQATAAPVSENAAHRAAAEQVIAYPSRLIYYLNEDSESACHDLDTRARSQTAEGQVGKHRSRVR